MSEKCPDCGHLHTPTGCVGEPTPSDIWAGVSPVVCDCGVWDDHDDTPTDLLRAPEHAASARAHIAAGGTE